MAATTYLSGEELQRLTNRKRLFYPVARIDLVSVFENYDLEEVDRPIGFSAVPKSVTIHRNSYKQADTWQVTFDAKDFPVTPEAVRAGAVEIRLFQTEGLMGEDPSHTVLSDNVLTGVPPTIVGLFDDVEVDYGETGKMVTLSGTDYTALFIAKSWPKDRRVRAGVQLHEALQTLMDEVNGAKNMRLVVVEDGVEVAVRSGRATTIGGIEEAISQTISTPVLGATEGRANRKRIKVMGENYWDVMYNLAVRYGKILFVRGLDVVLTNPQFYIEGKTNVLKTAWGQNLLGLRMSRKIGKQRSPSIEIRSYDDEAREPIVVRYPSTAQAKALGFTEVKQKKSTGETTIEEEVQVFRIDGIKDRRILEEAARARFNLLARSEQIVHIETRDLKDLDGESLIDIQAGDALSISFLPLSLDLLETMPEGARIKTLVEKGYTQQVAETLAESIEKANFFRKPMRVKEATIDWDVESGITISAELHNFVIIDLQDRKA